MTGSTQAETHNHRLPCCKMSFGESLLKSLLEKSCQEVFQEASSGSLGLNTRTCGDRPSLGGDDHKTTRSSEYS
jgi:hypothetical protein